jgi:hypothetical protein
VKLYKSRNPLAPDPGTANELEVLRRIAKQINRGNGRFGLYEYLVATYRLYRKWRRSGLEKVTAKKVARHLGLSWRKGTSPFRIIIEATFPTENFKQKSRWVRALEFAADEKTPAKDLEELFCLKGGVAGCARKAARSDPKRRTDRDDWA